MRTEENWVTLEVSDGTAMHAYLARPKGPGPHPAMIVFQEALGVNAQIRGVTDRYAEQGFIALAPELFHRTQAGYETDKLDMDVLMPLVRSVTADHMIADAAAAHAWLTGHEDVDDARIAAVGFCMGGRAAYLANSTLPLAAAISYYAGGLVPGLLDRAATLHGRQLFFWGAKDAGIPPEQHRAVVDALRTAGKSFVNVEFSDTGHGFFNEQIEGRHHAPSARESWALGLAFLEDTLAK